MRCLTWNEAGLPVTLNYGGAGDIVGTYLSAHRSYCIECLTRVEVTSLPESRWQDAVEGIVAHARQTEELLAIVRNEPVQQRLQQLLVWLARKFGRSISLGEPIDLRLILITNNIALFGGADRSADERPIGERTDVCSESWLSCWNSHCCSACSVAKLRPRNRFRSSCQRRSMGPPLGTGCRLEHWQDVAGPLQLGSDMSARPVQLQQVEAIGKLLG